jgi:hypothetical protein
VYALSVLTGEDLANYWATALDPAARELILALSIKGSDSKPAAVIEETEPSWVASVPADVREQLAVASAASVGVRKLEEHYVGEIAKRDREIAAAHEQIGALQRQIDTRFSARLARLVNRVSGRHH